MSKQQVNAQGGETVSRWKNGVEKLHEVAQEIRRNFQIINSDFSAAIDKLDFPEAFFYCDPPYQYTKQYSNSKNFDHNSFWNWVRNISNQGHTVFVSEYNAPTDFECVWQKEAKSSLSANGVIGGNKVSVEKLFKLKK